MTLKRRLAHPLMELRRTPEADAPAGSTHPNGQAGWPELDRQAWEAAARPGRLRRGSSPPPPRPIEQLAMQQTYGQFLHWLLQRQQLDADEGPADRLTRDRFEAFLDETGATLPEEEVRTQARCLAAGVRMLAPAANWPWMAFTPFLNKPARPRSRHPREPTAMAGVLRGRLKREIRETQVIVPGGAMRPGPETLQVIDGFCGEILGRYIDQHRGVILGHWPDVNRCLLLTSGGRSMEVSSVRSALTSITKELMGWRLSPWALWR